jgi:DNA primase large subunit
MRESDIVSHDLCTQAAFESIRSTGKERVLEALKDGALKYRRFNKLAAEKELLAYLIARIIVSCMNNNYLTKRYALSVAKSSYEHIKYLKSAVLLKELSADFGISNNLRRYDECLHAFHRLHPLRACPA